jgi:hypothetical protein
MKNIAAIYSVIALVAFCLFTGSGAATANAQEPAVADDVNPSPCQRFAKEETFNNWTKALKTPAKVRCLEPSFEGADLDMKRLPSGLGNLVNLEVFSFGCLEKLETLPEEIGNLSKLEELIIDNGNGCSMNVSLPGSIGKLKNLRVLKLYGALDEREVGKPASPPSRIKILPAQIADLRKLEVLDLGRNGLTAVPPQIAGLTNLTTLRLDFNALRAVPAFVGNFKNLSELALDANEHIANLPASMAKFKTLRISLGGNALKLREQKSLRGRFPQIVFSFESEFDDARANEEAAKPKAKRRPRRK